jgi:Peptidase A4 family
MVMAKRLQVSGGLIAVLGLVAGVTAAVAGQTADHASSRPATAVTRHQSAQDASARASLLRYLGGHPFGPGEASVSMANPGTSGASTTQQGTGQQGIGQLTNYYWSGYQNTSDPGTFTAVTGTWRIPVTHCVKEQEMNAMWVGFDGVGNHSAEQVGTLAYCFKGVPTYYTWWDLYPAAATKVSDTVHPGDLVTGTVTRNGTSYTISLTDHTDPSHSFSTVQTCPATATCQNRSVEWIAMRPFLPQGIAPLAPFHWEVTNASQTSNGATGGISAGPNPAKITMLDVTMTYPLDSVSDLYRNGSSFNAHFLVSY